MKDNNKTEWRENTMSGVLAQIQEFFAFITNVIKEFFGFFKNILPTTAAPEDPSAEA